MLDCAGEGAYSRCGDEAAAIRGQPNGKQPPVAFELTNKKTRERFPTIVDN